MYDTYVNAVLSEQALDGNSLMTAYLDLNEKLDETDIEYESYLQNMGRQLFYTIASSYITLYLAIVDVYKRQLFLLWLCRISQKTG